jgi:hypothetical protein
MLHIAATEYSVAFGAKRRKASTPAGAIAKLNAAIHAALADPGVRRRLTALGAEIPAPEFGTWSARCIAPRSPSLGQ